MKMAEVEKNEKRKIIGTVKHSYFECKICNVITVIMGAIPIQDERIKFSCPFCGCDMIKANANVLLLQSFSIVEEE
jgi:transcription elongation factor Elf1